jgi:hypothetical protein
LPAQRLERIRTGDAFCPVSHSAICVRPADGCDTQLPVRPASSIYRSGGDFLPSGRFSKDV